MLLKKDLRDRAMLFVGLGGIVIAVAMSFFAVTRAPREAWDPLGSFPVQHVTNGPNIRVTDTVNVTGTKCTHETVLTRGSKYWQAVDVRGSIIYDGQGVGTLQKGCTTLTFQNRIPDDVVAIVRAGGPKVWHIEGTTTPLKPGGEQGVPRTYQSTDFTLVP